MFGLVGVALIGLSRGSCLSNSTLTALGFTPLTPYTPATNNTYCTGALTNATACVNLTNIVSIVDGQKAAALSWETANFTNALSNASSVITDFQNYTAYTFNNSTVGKKLNGTAITTAIVTTATNLSTLGSTFSNYTSSTNLTTQVTTCLSSVNTSINGAYCLMISSQASTYATVTGTNVQITTTTDAPALVVEPCLPLIFTTCYLNSVASFFDTFTSQTTARANLTTACGNITTLASCLTNYTACNTSMPAMFTLFFTPTGSNIGTTLSTTFGTSLNTVRAYALTTSRLLAAAATTLTSSYQVSSTGYDVMTNNTGLNSNSTSKGISFFGLGFLIMLFALVLN